MKTELYKLTKFSVREMLDTLGIKGEFIELHYVGSVYHDIDEIISIKTGGK